MFPIIAPSPSHQALLERLVNGVTDIQAPVWGMLQEALLTARDLIDVPTGSVRDTCKTYVDVTYGVGKYLEKNALKKYKKAVSREYLEESVYEIAHRASTGEEYMNDAAACSLGYLYEIVNFIRTECEFFLTDDQMLPSQMSMMEAIGVEMGAVIRYFGQVTMRQQPDAQWQPLVFDGIPEALILQRISGLFGVTFQKYEDFTWEAWQEEAYKRAQRLE